MSPISGPRLASSTVCVQVLDRQARAQCSDVPQGGTGLPRNWTVLPRPRPPPHSPQQPEGLGRPPGSREMVLREGARGQTLRKVAFLASASGTAQGSCAPTTGQTLRAAVWSANCRAGETHSGDFHTPRSQRFNGQSGRVCRAQPEACVSVRARALSVPLILRSFPSFVFFFCFQACFWFIPLVHTVFVSRS